MTKEQLEKLKEKMVSALADLKQKGALVEQEQDKGNDADESVLKGLQEAYTKSEASWNTAKESVQKAMASYKIDAEQDSMLAELDGVSTKDVDGVDTTDKSFGTHKRAPAAAIDYDQKFDDHAMIFNKYLANGRQKLSGQENDLLHPTSASFTKGAEGAVAPPHLVAQLLGTNWMHQMGMQKELNYLRKGSSTMVSSSNTLGGYTVPQDFRLPILEVPGEQPFILSRATVIPSSTGTVTMPKATQSDTDEYGGFSGEWISEGGLKNKTDTRFEQVSIQTHEYAAYTQISIRLLERSALAMESFITRKARAKIMNELNRVFLQGTGTGQPTGILSTAGIRQVNRAVASQVSREDIIDLKRALKPYHRSGSIFILGDDVGGYLEKLTVSATDLRPLFSASMANGPYDRLVGFPYIETTQTPTLGEEGDISFVDLREYYVPMETEIVIKRSDDYDIVHNLATIVVYVVVGGQLVEPRVCAELDTPSGS
ncbi:MAG: phage major capsid protein [Candidatus Absconditabacterales bacterium]|jgi:HK97 family phage major capsid protein